MEKERCIEIKNAMKKYIRKEGQKEKRKGRTRNMYRQDEMKKYMVKKCQKEHSY